MTLSVRSTGVLISFVDAKRHTKPKYGNFQTGWIRVLNTHKHNERKWSSVFQSRLTSLIKKQVVILKPCWKNAQGSIILSDRWTVLSRQNGLSASKVQFHNCPPFLSKFINMFLWAKLTKQHIYRLLHLELQIVLHLSLIHNVRGHASSAFRSLSARKPTGKAPAECKTRAWWRREQTGATHTPPVGSCPVAMERRMLLNPRSTFSLDRHHFYHNVSSSASSLARVLVFILNDAVSYFVGSFTSTCPNTDLTPTAMVTLIFQVVSGFNSLAAVQTGSMWWYLHTVIHLHRYKWLSSWNSTFLSWILPCLI